MTMKNCVVRQKQSTCSSSIIGSGVKPASLQ